WGAVGAVRICVRRIIGSIRGGQRRGKTARPGWILGSAGGGSGPGDGGEDERGVLERGQAGALVRNGRELVLAELDVAAGGRQSHPAAQHQEGGGGRRLVIVQPEAFGDGDEVVPQRTVVHQLLAAAAVLGLPGGAEVLLDQLSDIVLHGNSQHAAGAGGSQVDSSRRTGV